MDGANNNDAVLRDFLWHRPLVLLGGERLSSADDLSTASSLRLANKEVGTPLEFMYGGGGENT